MGVSAVYVVYHVVLTCCSISRTMGESFKYYAQALVGYLDELSMDPVAGMPQVPDQTLVGMESAY